MNYKLVIFLVSFFFGVSLLIAQTPEEIITKKMTKVFEKSKLPGFSVAMVTKDGTLYQKGFGYADLVSKKSYTQNTIQNIASTSKTFIGVALMKLVDQQKLQLDDDINIHLPFKVVHPKHPDTPITIRHLATHTSGIKDLTSHYDLKSYYLDKNLTKTEISKKGFSMEEKIFLKRTEQNKHIPLRDYLQKVLDKEGEWYTNKNFYDFKPGSIYEYSNVGAALAAYIVEVISELQYDEFTKKEIIEPLEMESTAWFYKDVDMTRFATRYVGKKNAIPPFYELNTYPDGGLKTSVSDLSLFLKEMLKGYSGESDFLSRESFKVLFENHLNVPDGERNGIFWDIFGETGEGDIGHSGVDPGVNTYMYFNPSNGVGKILIVNRSGTREITINVWQNFIGMETLFLKK